MLTYSFENRGKEALYTWLYKCMKDDILSGKLKSGERLPSKRSFARQLGVSTLTVENAYALLQTEGYVRSFPKKGYYVADIQPAFHRLQPGAVSAPASDVTIPEQPEERQYFADFSSNQTRKENFPFSVWTKLIRQVMA
ncbi:MAG: winged helix-turn-helix domain-containing protein, partial [Lachnospiraceae bacterium]|nr:winged helix-turn-helix domain-containing protein [Lachnospiraceae bacterium]